MHLVQKGVIAFLILSEIEINRAQWTTPGKAGQANPLVGWDIDERNATPVAFWSRRRPPKRRIGVTDMGYWDYYDPGFDWSDTAALVRPDLDLSRHKLATAGMSATEAQRCVDSGFVFEPHSGNIIDRYYGGALMSADERTRFSLETFVTLDRTPRSRLPVHQATSFDDVRRIVDAVRKRSVADVLFRGQIQNYLVPREVSNPFVTIPDFGEISLIPSLWRVMLSRNRNSFHSFQSLESIEWSRMLDSVFDMNDIEHRMHAVAGENSAVYNLFDFEDSGDPVLQRYAECQLDLRMGMNVNLADLLATMLQHYGLLSPVLDLTSSLDVALFFATHQFTTDRSVSRYQFIGTNARQAVLYIIRKDASETVAYQSGERVIKEMFPLRPARQNCEICKSSPYALNLAADLLLAVIRLDFDTARQANEVTWKMLFPSASEDSFLRALKTIPHARTHLIDFA